MNRKNTFNRIWCRTYRLTEFLFDVSSHLVPYLIVGYFKREHKQYYDRKNYDSFNGERKYNSFLIINVGYYFSKRSNSFKGRIHLQIHLQVIQKVEFTRTHSIQTQCNKIYYRCIAHMLLSNVCLAAHNRKYSITCIIILGLAFGQYLIKMHCHIILLPALLPALTSGENDLENQ